MMRIIKNNVSNKSIEEPVDYSGPFRTLSKVHVRKMTQRKILSFKIYQRKEGKQILTSEYLQN